MSPPGVEWKQPWVAVTEVERQHLERELGRELSPEHVLAGRQARAVARRVDDDDVLFVLDGGPEVAVVHLTYASRPERSPEWPATRRFSDLEEWVRSCMLVDHAEYRGRMGVL